ncbi:MAG: hypothetical protein E2O39_14205, partial [Planctomycetota bacterium]
MTPPTEYRQERDGTARWGGAGTSFQGTIELVTYHDERSLYTVLRIAPETGFQAPVEGALFEPTRVTAVGRAADPAVGLRVRLIGAWGTHPKHGTQFEFEGLEVLPPIDVEGLVRYLSSKVFEGVGETIARRITDKLGPGTLATIRDHPESLKGIRGLRADVARGLTDKVRAQLLAHQTGAFLRGLGLGPLQAQAVIAALGVECEAALRANPYRIASVPTLGFALADEAGRHLGFAEDDPRRLAAGALQAMKLASNDGHSLLPLADLVTRATELLSGVAPREKFIESLAGLEEERELVFERELVGAEEPFGDDVLVYLPWLHASEAGLA